MTFMRKFDTLLHKSNGNLCKIDSQDGITIYNYDNNFNLLSSKKLMDGDLSFLDFWFDIDANDNIYGLINDKMGTLLSYKISNKYIFKSKFLEYYPNEESIKFVYINSNSGSTNLFYYKLNVNNPYKCSLIHHYQINNVWHTNIVDSISYNVLTNFVVIYNKNNIPRIFYYNLVDGFEELFLSIFNPDLNSWCTPIQITDSKKAKMYLSAMKDNRNCYHILFSENNSNRYYCTYINGYINNLTFNVANSSIISDTVACTFPNIIQYNNKIYAHWIEYHNLFVRYSNDYGNTWSNTSIYNNALADPFVCCNYHSNLPNTNVLNYFTLYMNQNSTNILGIDYINTF